MAASFPIMDSHSGKQMHSAKTVHLDSHASDTLQYIRASMDAASSLTVPGSAAIAVGTTGVLAAAISSAPVLRGHWLVIWIAAALVAMAWGGTLLLRQFAPDGVAPIFSRGPVRKFLLCWAPALFAGAAMTVVHLSHGHVDAIAGTWLLIYGCSLMSASAITNKHMGVLGVAFFVLGAITLRLPSQVHMWMLGVGFGGLHLGFGFYVRQVTHGS